MKNKPKANLYMLIKIEIDKDIKDTTEFKKEFCKKNDCLWIDDYSEWDCNMIGTCFELFDLEEEDINYSLREYLSEIIMFNLRNTLDKEGIDLLDNKQKEKDRKELMDKQQLKLNFN